MLGRPSAVVRLWYRNEVEVEPGLVARDADQPHAGGTSMLGQLAIDVLVNGLEQTTGDEHRYGDVPHAYLGECHVEFSCIGRRQGNTAAKHRLHRTQVDSGGEISRAARVNVKMPGDQSQRLGEAGGTLDERPIHVVLLDDGLYVVC